MHTAWDSDVRMRRGDLVLTPLGSFPQAGVAAVPLLCPTLQVASRAAGSCGTPGRSRLSPGSAGRSGRGAVARAAPSSGERQHRPHSSAVAVGPTSRQTPLAPAAPLAPGGGVSCSGDAFSPPQRAFSPYPNPLGLMWICQHPSPNGPAPNAPRGSPCRMVTAQRPAAFSRPLCSP